jgi:hypothetical protein
MYNRALLLVWLSTCLSVVLVSCCTDDFRWTGEVRVALVPTSLNEHSSSTVVDTIDGPFRYQASLAYREFSFVPTDLFIPSRLMATSCDESYDTELDPESIVVRVDRSLILDGEPLPVTTNLATLLLDISSDRSPNYVHAQGVFLDFDEEVLSRLALPTGWTTFTLTAMITTGDPITEETEVYLRL